MTGPHVGRGRDHAFRVAHLTVRSRQSRSTSCVVTSDVRVEIDHLLPQLAIEPGHDRDDQDQHRHAERHADDRDQRDDRDERALRFQITKRKEKAERQLQSAIPSRETLVIASAGRLSNGRDCGAPSALQRDKLERATNASLPDRPCRATRVSARPSIASRKRTIRRQASIRGSRTPGRGVIRSLPSIMEKSRKS